MENKRIEEILEKLKEDDRLTDEEREALDYAHRYVTSIHIKEEDEYDFQGWRLDKLTMGNLREFVGNNDELSNDTKLFVLQDDGMGYGANNGYCTSIYVSKNRNNKNEVMIWF